MHEKKKKIIESAIKLFAENGFHSTSMQTIADEIGIAKGSLYLQFKSKEELLLSILEHYQDEIFERMSFVAKDTSLTPKENLVKQVYIRFSGFQKNGDFIKMQMSEQLNHESDSIQRCLFKMRYRLLNWQKQVLLNVYSDKITPYIWDLVLIFNSMMKEYMFLLVFEKKVFDIKTVSEFIVNRLDGIITEMLENRPKSVVTPEMMADIDISGNLGKVPSQEERISLEIKKIDKGIHNLNLSDEMKDELLSTIYGLQEEIKKEEPRKFMVKALIAYLVSNEGVEVDRLKMLLDLKFDFQY